MAVDPGSVWEVPNARWFPKPRDSWHPGAVIKKEANRRIPIPTIFCSGAEPDPDDIGHFVRMNCDPFKKLTNVYFNFTRPFDSKLFGTEFPLMGMMGEAQREELVQLHRTYGIVRRITATTIS